MSKAALEYVIRSKDESQGGVDGALKNTKRLESGMDKAAKAIKSVLTVAGFMMIARKIKGVSDELIGLGSDAEEIDSKFTAVFKNQSKEAENWAKTFSRDIGRNFDDVKKNLSTFQDTFVPLGFARDSAADLSKQLITLGTDMASFNNIAEKDVFRDLQSGIVGNVEVFRKYGVIINQARLNQELLNMGIEGGAKAATEAEKAQARLNILLASTSDAQGDAIRTADGYANRLRSVDSLWTQIKTTIGKAMLPLASEGMGNLKAKLQPIADWLAENQNKITNFFLHFPEIAGVAFQGVKIALGKIFSVDFLVKWGSSWWESFKAVGKSSINTMYLFLKAIGATFWEPLKVGFEWIGYGITVAFREVIDFLVSAFNFLLTPVNALISGLESILTLARKGVTAIGVLLNNINPFTEKQNMADELAKVDNTSIGRIGIAPINWGELEKPTSNFRDAGENIAEAWRTAINGGVDHLKTLKDELSSLMSVAGEPYREAFAEILPKLEEILNRDLPNALSATGAQLPAGGGGSSSPARSGFATLAEDLRKSYQQIADKFRDPIELKQRQIAEEITLTEKILDTLAYEDDMYTEIADTLRSLKAEQKKLSEEAKSTVKGFWANLGESIKSFFGVDYGAYAESTGKSEEELSDGDKASAWLETAAAGLGSVLIQVAEWFGSMMMNTESFRVAMEYLESHLKVVVEMIGGPLVQALAPLLTFIVGIAEVLANFLAPVLQMVGMLLMALSPALKAIGQVVISLTKIIMAVLPALLPIVDLLIAVITPVLMAIAPILDMVASLLSALSPIIEAVTVVLMAILAPVMIVVTVVQWLGTILKAFGQLIEYLVTFQWDKIGKITVGDLGKMMSENMSYLTSVNNAGDYKSKLDGWEPGEFSMNNDELLNGLNAGLYSGGSGSGSGSSVTVTKPPDQYFNIYLEGQPVEGTEGKLIDIDTMISVLKKELGYDNGITVSA